MKSRRPSAAWCALTCTALGAMGALYAAAVQAQPAQSWPAKPVTFLVAAVPGGSNEAEIRLLRPPCDLARVHRQPQTAAGTSGSIFVLGSTSISRTSNGIAARIGIAQIGHRIW